MVRMQWSALAADLDLKKLLRALQARARRRFQRATARRIRPVSAGKIADTFNEMVSANQRLCHELERAGQMVGKEGKTRIRVSSERRTGAWGAMESSVNTLIDDLLWPTAEVTRTITAVAQGRSHAEHAARSRWPTAQGRIPAIGERGQRNDRADGRVHLRSDARGARSGHRRKVGRPGAVLGASGVWKDLTDNVNSMARI